MKKKGEKPYNNPGLIAEKKDSLSNVGWEKGLHDNLRQKREKRKRSP